MFENKDFGKYLHFKNEVIGFGVISVESWISATVVFVSSSSLLTKYYLDDQIKEMGGARDAYGESLRER
jgi:hypothetical protein